MTDKKLTTAWIWTHDSQFRGLRIDTDRGLLQWHDSLECRCGDDGSFAEQTLAEYMEQQVPGGIGDVPDDILSEIDTAVNALLQTAA